MRALFDMRHGNLEIHDENYAPFRYWTYMEPIAYSQSLIPVGTRTAQQPLLAPQDLPSESNFKMLAFLRP